MKYKNFWISIALISLFIIGSYFRLINLSNNPPSIFSDEVDAQYQAFIYKQCGTDYFGNKFPIHFQSFSDYRTPIFIRTIALFNSVRLSQSIFGIFSLFLIFLILKHLFVKNKIIWIYGLFISACSFWLIHYSRTGFEVSQMLFFLFLFLLFWLKFIKKPTLPYLLISCIALILSFYTYSTAKLFVVLLLPPLFLIWRKEIFSLGVKKLSILIVICSFLVLPMITDTISGRSGYRFSYINIFSDPTISKEVDYQRYLDATNKYGQQIGLSPDLSSKLIHNKVVLWTNKFINNYFESFSSQFLFLKGDGNLRQGFGFLGYLFFTEIILIIFGLGLVLKKKDKFTTLMFLWLILAPIPYALTRDSAFTHATRLIIIVPALMYFSILGFSQISKLKYQKIFIILIFTFNICQLTYFWHYYNIHYPQISAKEWHYGIDITLNKIKKDYNNSPKIFFSSNPEPILPFFLWNFKYQPSDNPCAPAKEIIWDNNDNFNALVADNKYYFGRFEWSQFKNSPHFNNQNLFMISSKDIETIDSQNFKYEILYQLDKKYLEQEIYYLVRFNNND